MRDILLTCLIVVVLLSSPCTGGAASGNAPAAANPTQAVPSVQTRTTSVGMLCPTQNEAARLQYNAALDLQQQGRFQEAEAAYRQAIDLDPRYCDAMDNLGQMLRRNGATDQAISWYQRSLAVKPDNGVAHQDLAVAYKTLGDTGKAAAEFQWLIDHEPMNPEGYYGLGDVHLGSGQAVAAVAPLQRAEELYRANASPLLSDAQYELGIAFYRQKAYRQARDYLALVYPDRENDPNVNYLLGLCYLDPSLGNRGKAREYLLKAQKLGVNIPQEVLQTLEN